MHIIIRSFRFKLPHRIKHHSYLVFFVVTAFLLVISNLLLFLFLSKQDTHVVEPTISEVTYINEGKVTDFTTYFKVLATKKGAAYAFTVMKTANFPPNLDLHLLGHTVGEILYKQQGAKGITICTQDFRNACSHAIVIGLLNDKGVKGLDEITKACNEAPGGKGAYTMCFHGLGHGILAYNGYDFPKMIAMCKKTGTQMHDNQEYIQCIGGAVMEIISGGGHDEYTWAAKRLEYLTKSDPLSPCDAAFMPDEAKTMCYTYLTPWLFQAAGADLQNPVSDFYPLAFSFCNQIPQSQTANRSACYGGFGKEFIVLAKDRDIRDMGHMTLSQLQKVKTWCEMASDPQGNQDCISSAINSMYWGGENAPDSSIALCNLLQGPDETTCYNTLFNSVSYYRGTDNTLCNKVNNDVKQTCQSILKS